jgi:putative Mg2+ transporter-C (MgtC) family protein
METIIEGIKWLAGISEFQTLFKLILIVILSGFVGFERESWNKPAGFRTHVLVGISAVLVMVCGEYLFNQYQADPTRIPAQLLSGIGFLGAGTILRDGFNVKGLTTAAGLLAVTCIGLAVGAGYYIGAIIATAVVYVVLSYSHILSEKLEHFNFLDFEVTLKNPKENIKEIKNVLNNYDLEIVKIFISDEKEKNDIVKIIARYKENLDVNSVMTNILEIENVTGVVEVK